MTYSVRRYIQYGMCFSLTLCIGYGFVSCRRDNSSQQDLMSRLRLAVQETGEGKTKSFSMGSLTNFAWDGLYVFGPYTPPDEINKSLGFSWRPAKESGIEYSDTFCLLVFTHGSNVAQHCEYPRSDGDWSALSSTKKIAPDSAIFSAKREKSGFLTVTMAGK